jgi:hypothetical protein
MTASVVTASYLVLGMRFVPQVLGRFPEVPRATVQTRFPPGKGLQTVLPSSRR